ncbi:MAG: hypothetical protein US96_C0010G0025 [Candidatus Woesebacteria bacterium GW2011_GWB1_38_5b]|uniref:Uncharacterized protein n=1 Tax=Candidatus Woesebacteria bacterium GW2011_GWB1_38_5b TaxID=1618569 RepID=A0A0G0MPA8_9BACT|nr:MAG: hypothetical protein US96_C0010G0025 [Candidatus Woesebacteria bacterium GW2011_GWB1_38_5b]
MNRIAKSVHLYIKLLYALFGHRIPVLRNIAWYQRHLSKQLRSYILLTIELRITWDLNIVLSNPSLRAEVYKYNTELCCRCKHPRMHHNAGIEKCSDCHERRCDAFITKSQFTEEMWQSWIFSKYVQDLDLQVDDDWIL